MAQEATLFNALTAGSKIIGNITADKDIRIDGILEGDLNCEGKVVVGENGQIKGNITCQNAEIMGKIVGNIQTEGTLALRETSNLTGDAKTCTLIVEPNAVFHGKCDMNH